jgi:hypothetical protein
MNKLACVLLLAAGCATASAPRGPQVVSVSEGVQVCADRAALVEGQEVRFSRRVCRQTSPKVTAPICESQTEAVGQATQVVDGRCATIQLALGADVRPGDQIDSP